MKAMIIGGGIGGPIAAMALQRVGIDAVVYDGDDGPAEAPSITIMRGALQRALTDEAQSRGIDVRYGKRFVGYAETTAGILAQFQDGTEDRGDLLIGADGIRSRVRALMDPEAPAPNYTGLLNLGGVAQGLRLAPTPDTMHMIWGRRAFFGYAIRPGEAWWFANLGSKREPSRQELAVTSTAEWKGRLRDLFTDDPALITTLIDSTEQIEAFPIHDMPSLARWHAGRVALLGDAAHAVSPSAGHGASLAMEDALMLAGCLRDIQEPQRAFGRYESLRRSE